MVGKLVQRALDRVLESEIACLRAESGQKGRTKSIGRKTAVKIGPGDAPRGGGSSLGVRTKIGERAGAVRAARFAHMNLITRNGLTGDRMGGLAGGEGFVAAQSRITLEEQKPLSLAGWALDPLRITDISSKHLIPA